MPVAATEIHTAYEVQCANCFEYITLRIALDGIYARRCPACKHLLPRSFFLLQVLRRNATRMFSFDCDACGRENTSFGPPTHCRHCGEPVTRS